MKNDADIYRKPTQCGDFEKAFRIAQKHLAQAEADYKKPSESCPACTVHHLVREIVDKVNSV